MNDTRTKREEREEIIYKCLNEIAELYGVENWHHVIETWTSESSEAIVKDRNGIQITMDWNR